MKVTIDKLQNLDWDQLKLYGNPEDEQSWSWGKAPRYTDDVLLGSAQDVYEASTGNDTGLVWEMKTEEGEEGYEKECERRAEWEAEEYEVVLPEGWD